MLKIGRTLQTCSRICVANSGFERLSVAELAKKQTTVHVQVRYISVGDVFGKVDLSKIPDLPNLPLPLPDKIPIAELAAAGQSVLNDLGLFSWFTPPSYIRYALESLHLYLDVPWWLTIVIVSTSLRLLTFAIPVRSQRLVAIQSKYKKELKDFTARINDARMEGDNLQAQQIFLEQHKFMKSKGINLIGQLGVILANGGIFIANFLAIKKMTSAQFPGFETGGALWFPNLLETDSYMGLPGISAVTTYVVLKLGIDSGMSSDQMSPYMKIGFQYGVPVIVFVAGWWFPSAICVHWVTSNTISLVFAGLFKVPSVRAFLKIPPIVKYDDKSLKTNAVREAWANYRNQRSAPPSLSSLRRADYDNFKKAGTGKPVG